MESENVPRTSKRILLVDDEPQLLFSVKEYLRRVGYDVVPAESGPTALDVVIDSPPDLIISDILMDGMDGLEFQKRVNALTGDSIPFIFLTAKGATRDRVAGLQNGADDYIVKPFDPEELEARVGSVLHRIEQTRQEERHDLDRLRRRLLNEVSRQLRAPLSSIVAHLNLLMTERFGEDEAKQRRYLARALEDASTLRGLIDDLSWASTVVEDELALKLEPVRVAPIVRTAAANAARLASEKGVDLRILCGGLLSANMDSLAMTRALAGLLESAVTISPTGSQVLITARRADEGGLEFVIMDGGYQASDQSPAPAPVEWPTSILDLARRVVKGHGGRFSTATEGPQRSIVIWLPGRIAKHVGRS
jgi:DNA-binding response OmpR family regulator